MADGCHFEFHKSAVTTQWMVGFLSNLVCWCKCTSGNGFHEQNLHIRKNNMAATAILDFWKVPVHWHLVNVMLCNISFSRYFDVVDV